MVVVVVVIKMLKWFFKIFIKSYLSETDVGCSILLNLSRYAVCFEDSSIAERVFCLCRWILRLFLAFWYICVVQHVLSCDACPSISVCLSQWSSMLEWLAWKLPFVYPSVFSKATQVVKTQLVVIIAFAMRITQA